MRLLDSRTIFPNNPVLPVSPYFPGIELVTIATRWLTGTPTADRPDDRSPCGPCRARAVRLSRSWSERVAHRGPAGSAYSSTRPGQSSIPWVRSTAIRRSPSPFPLRPSICSLFQSMQPQPKRGRLFALALVSIGAMVVSHHVTAWLTVAFLVVWAAGLRFVNDPLGHRFDVRALHRLRLNLASRRRAAGAAEGAIADRGPRRSRRRCSGRGVDRARGSCPYGYVGPLIQEGVDSAAEMLGRFHGNRTLFQNSAGGGTPGWESALILAAAVVVLPDSLGLPLFGDLEEERSRRKAALSACRDRSDVSAGAADEYID